MSQLRGVVLLVVAAATAGAQEDPTFAAVHAKVLRAAEHPVARLVEFGQSAGGRPLLMLEIGKTVGERGPADRPAVFVGANIVGHHRFRSCSGATPSPTPAGCTSSRSERVARAATCGCSRWPTRRPAA